MRFRLREDLSCLRGKTLPIECWSCRLVERVKSVADQGLVGRFRKAVTWNMAGAIAGQGTIFATNISLANMLGKSIFGEYAFLYSTVLAIGTLAQFGTGLTVLKYVAEFRAADPERAARILSLCRTITIITGLLAAITLLLAAHWLAISVLKRTALGLETQVVAGYLWFSVMTGVQIGALAGLERYRSIARAIATHAPLHAIACLFGAWRWGLLGAVGGLAVSALLRWIIFEVTLFKDARRAGVRLHCGGSWAEVRVVGHFAIPAALSGLSTLPAQWAAAAFLVSTPGGHGEMALYAAANNLRNLILFVPGVIHSAGTSLLNNTRRSANGASYKSLFWMNLRATGGAAIIGAVVVSAFGVKLLSLYGHSFEAGYGALVLLLCGAVFDAVGLGIYQLIQIQERMWLSLFAVALPRDLLLISLAYLLVPQYGAYGLAGAFSGSSLLALLATVIIGAYIGLDTTKLGEKVLSRS